jgi:hypothetical protein
MLQMMVLTTLSDYVIRLTLRDAACDKILHNFDNELVIDLELFNGFSIIISLEVVIIYMKTADKRHHTTP